MLGVIFATTRCSARRNRLSDFPTCRNGIIAMKLDEGEATVDVTTASEAEEALLTTREGQCVRFPVTEAPASRALPR
jgi:DNA gyrase subunit A